MRRSKENTLLYIGAWVAVLPMLLLRDFTPGNELRYLSIADEAMRNHTFFTFANHGMTYADKPPLYLWVVMLCRWLMGGHHLWLLSLFSLLPAWGIVRTMDEWTAQETDGEGHMLARLMLLTCGLFFGAALTLRMDMLMCFFIVCALRQFWRMWKGEEDAKRASLLFPIFLFLAVFTKGPLGLLVPLAGTVAFLVASRSIGCFFRYWGFRTWSMLAVLCSLWFGAVYAEGGAEYLYNLLVHQTMGRAVDSFHHGEPPYYYVFSLWYSLAPWSLLAVGVVVAASRPQFVRSDLQRFFLSIVIATFLLLSCISSKLQIYLLPIVPFIIYSTAMFLPRFRGGVWLRIALAIPSAVFALSLPALFLAVFWAGMSFLDEGMLYAAALALTLVGIHSLYLLYDMKRPILLPMVVRWLAVGMFMAVFLGGWALPRLNAYIGYGELCGRAMELSQKYGIMDFRTWHVPRSESMDVYLQRPVEVVCSEKPPQPSKGKPFLLLTRNCDLCYYSQWEAQVVGSYAVVVCP